MTTSPATTDTSTSTRTGPAEAGTASTVEAAAGRVETLDPRGLLVDVNVRDSVRVERDFIASVRDLGVLVPIVAVRTADGGVRVRFGHRRARAAVVAGLPSVPVLVVADEATTTAGQVERIVTQWAENEHRSGLTLTEQVGVVAQLAAFGVSPAQIAHRTRITRPRVDAALTVAGSDVARRAAVEHELDLTEAAVVAEFAADPDGVALLVAAAGTGRFEHVAQRLRDDRVRAERRAAFTAALAADGVRVVDAGVEVLLRDLTDPGGAVLTTEAHAACPGHAARIERCWGPVDPATGFPAVAPDDDSDVNQDDDSDVHVDEEDDQDDDEDEGDEEEPVDGGTTWAEYPSAVWVCTDPAAHGHLRRIAYGTRGQARPVLAELTPAEAAAARADRRTVIECNKAWGSAVTVRREWVRVLLTRRTPPKGAAALIATALACDPEVVTRGRDLAADLLGWDRGVYGRSPALTGLIDQASEARAQVLALAVVLAGYEDATYTGSWRTVHPATRRYLTFLTACGYTLADVERRASGEAPLPTTDTTAGSGGEAATG